MDVSQTAKKQSNSLSANHIIRLYMSFSLIFGGRVLLLGSFTTYTHRNNTQSDLSLVIQARM